MRTTHLCLRLGVQQGGVPALLVPHAEVPREIRRLQSLSGREKQIFPFLSSTHCLLPDEDDGSVIVSLVRTGDEVLLGYPNTLGLLWRYSMFQSADCANNV